MTSWFNIRAAAYGSPPEILIYGEIGSGGVTAADFDKQLKALGSVSEIVLRINSPGGDVFVAQAIYSMLARHPAHITVYIDGIAASAASLIAMAASTIIMPANAMMMLHNPAGAALGTSDDMMKLAGMLDKIAASMATAYAKKSGLPHDRVLALMDAETWLSAAEAVELGFADRVEEPMRIAATYDLSRYSHPPAPTTIAELSANYWARHGAKPRAVAEVAPVVASTSRELLPESSDAIYARYNRSGKPTGI